MLSYGLFFCLAGLAIRDTAQARGWRRLAAAGVVVPFFALAAAAFDASENVALLLTLAGRGGSFTPPFAAVCSSIKFTLIGIAILYVLCGLAFRVRARAAAELIMSTPNMIDPAQQPRRNVECKARDPDPDRSLAVCQKIGAEDHGEIWQRDTYFEVVNGGLKLREERPGKPHLIQFERADEPQQRESRYRIYLLLLVM